VVLVVVVVVALMVMTGFVSHMLAVASS